MSGPSVESRAMPRPDLAADARAELAGLAEAGRLRQRPVSDAPVGRTVAVRGPGGRRNLVTWASNDYLGLAHALPVRNGATRAVRRAGAGAGAARLLGGHAVHRQLELAVARFLGTGDCLLTTSGFQANLCAVTTLASDPEDVVILDRACHASTYDGVKLSAGTLLRFLHNDLDDLARQLLRTDTARRRIVCVESVYSMDGDLAPLAGIAALCAQHSASLVVDEAHALGVLGPGGRGLCAATGVRPDLLVATCSKSLGSQGGLIAGDAALVELAVNRGRPFIFSTAPCPAAAGAASAALVQLERHPEWPAELAVTAARLRDGLRAQGWNVPVGETPIIPVIVGDERTALDLAARLAEAGHHCPAIRPPTVPEGTCRLRLTVTRAHRPSDLRKLLQALGSPTTNHQPPTTQG
jgi:8-amino-7-oxononanoate synthase